MYIGDFNAIHGKSMLMMRSSHSWGHPAASRVPNPLLAPVRLAGIQHPGAQQGSNTRIS